MSSYEHYVKDEAFLAYYNDYQKRYAGQIAERDKVTLGLVAEHTKGKGSLLDIGCSTCNLLLHLRRAFPGLVLYGGDLAESSIEEAARNPELSTAIIGRMDMLEITGRYDCIIGNAVSYLFAWPEYERAVESVAKALNPDGVFISLEWYHSFGGQDYAIREVTPSHPDGLMIYTRPIERVARIYEKYGLESLDFRPFMIPIDRPEPEDKSGDPITSTVKIENGNRLCMRGALYQPWAHVVATKR
jgi:SAM-dependent methyltransferase